MKLTLRIGLFVVSPVLAYFSAMWGVRFTLAPLRSGGYEGTPATAVAAYAVFALVLIVLVVAGNLLINRFPSRNSQ